MTEDHQTKTVDGAAAFQDGLEASRQETIGYLKLSRRSDNSWRHSNDPAHEEPPDEEETED